MPGYPANEGHRDGRMTKEMPRPQNHDGSKYSISDSDSDVVHPMKDTPPTDIRGTTKTDENQ